MINPNRLSVCLLAALLAPALVAQVTLSPNPSRVLGHPQATLKTTSPNYVEGRELSTPYAIAIDKSTSPPILYAADTGNNRVLAWRNASQFVSGATADMVIGQPDLFTTFSQGPGTSYSSTGLSQPTGLAVNAQGDLFVSDAGNNRILRYPKPFSNPVPAIPDLVIGQQTYSTRTANSDPDTRTISDRTVRLNDGSNVYAAPLLVDADGNLWVADAVNQRVLRFAAASVGAGATNMPRANLEVGQANFLVTSPRNPTNAGDLTSMGYPAGMAMDSTRQLYVCDSAHRVLLYATGGVVFASGVSASKKMGGVGNAQGLAQPPTQQSLYLPNAVFLVNDVPYVVDSGNHRILRFKKPDQWPIDGTAPAADDLIGQASYAEYKANAGNPWPRSGGTPMVSFNFPSAAVVAGSELFVADAFNNRVVVLPDPAATGGSSMYGKRVLGQQLLDANGTNLTEARGFFLLASTSAGLAVDTKSNPPHLYVTDTANHRILGFRDVRTVKLGDAADLVLGQENFNRNASNWAPGVSGQPSQYGLNLPQGLAVDSEGNLWVSDSANGRVLRFPSPFTRGNGATADLVLGKRNFTATRDSVPDPSSENFSYPVGIAFTTGGHLLISDSTFNRALLFLKPAAGFTSSMHADRVFGQASFTERTAAASSSDRQHFNTPLQISVDQGDRLFICDNGMNRVLLYDSITERASGASADTSITDLSAPRGIYSSAATGETWIAGNGGSGGGIARIRGSSTTPDLFVGPGTGELALGVTTTPRGDPLVALSSHRVVFYSPAATVTNAANYEPELAPGMYASLWPFPGYGFPVASTTVAPAIPLPKELSDLQILINGEATPLHFVSSGQINFLTTMSMPTSGGLEIQLVQKSTGEILAVGCTQNSSKTGCQSPYLALQASSYSVGIFTADSSGRNQIRALNVKADGTYYGGCTGDNITPCLNSPSNPVKGGDFVELYLTGQGLDAGTYTDGAAPGPGHTTARLPQVYLGPQRKQLADSDVTFSGLNQYFPGLWQVNIKIPTGEGAPIGNTVAIQVIYRSSDSWRGTKFLQYIAVTQ